MVTVTTAYPGADPETVSAFITRPLQQAIASAPGIDYMTGTSAESTSTITVYMRLNYDPNAAVSQILSKVDQVSNQLPPQSQVPVINETVGDATALIYFAFSSKQMSQQQVNDYVLRVAQPKIQGVNGVSQAQIVPAGTDPSGNAFALRAWLNPTSMAALGITPADVSNALRSNNYISAVGSTRNAQKQVTITATTSLNDLAQFQNLVVKNIGNTVIRLKDVAQVQLGAENYDQAVYFNGVPAVFIGVQPTPDANDLDVAAGVHQAFSQLQSGLPPGMHAIIAYDASIYITRSIHEVLVTIFITLAVVVVVIFLFLGSLRSLLLPAVAIPLSSHRCWRVHAGGGFHHQPIDAAGGGAGYRPGGGRRHHRGGEYPPPYRGRHATIRRRHPRRTRAGGPHHRHGDHAGGGIRAHWFPRRPHRQPVHGVCLHAGVHRSGVHDRGTDAYPHAEFQGVGHTPSKGLTHFLDQNFERLRHVYDRSLHAVLGARPLVLLVAAAVFVSIPFLFLGTRSELAPDEDQGIVLVAGLGPATATLHYLNSYAGQIRKIFDDLSGNRQRIPD